MSESDMGESVIRWVDWNLYSMSTGGAGQFGNTLLRLIRSRTPHESSEVWKEVENFVFAQDTIYSAAEPTIDVILAVLTGDPPRHVKIVLLDLMFLLLHGDSFEDPGLRDRCHARALRGMWLLVREAAGAEGPVRDAVLEVIDLIDPVQSEALQAWLGS